MALHTSKQKLLAGLGAVAAVGVAGVAPFADKPAANPSPQAGTSLAIMNKCTQNGDEEAGSPHAIENSFKNRFTIPTASDINGAVTLQKLMDSYKEDEEEFNQNQAAAIDGYIVEVKPGGVESCNCHATDPVYMDTHIYVAPSPNMTVHDKKKLLIVEVTPRLRTLLKSQGGEDWSTHALDQKLTGKHVKITGWLFYDGEHERNSRINYMHDPKHLGQEPTSVAVWRQTCWEIHPVTGFQVLP